MARGRTIRNGLIALALLLSAGSWADEPTTRDDTLRVRHLPLDLVQKRFVSGHKVTGWQLDERWYFGHAGGNNVGFVWQQRSTQITIGAGGFRWSRRF